MNTLRHISLFIAGIIIVLHSVFPHLHHQEVSSSQHAEIHNNVESDQVLSLSFLFHELTHKGQMEEVEISQSIDISVPTFIFIINYFNCAVFSVFQTDLRVASTLTNHFDSTFEYIQLSKGYSTSWGFRAPPVA